MGPCHQTAGVHAYEAGPASESSHTSSDHISRVFATIIYMWDCSPADLGTPREQSFICLFSYFILHVFVTKWYLICSLNLVPAINYIDDKLCLISKRKKRNLQAFTNEANV